MTKAVLSILVLTLLFSCNPQGKKSGSSLQSNAVFGDDDRQEVYQVEKKYQKWARSTAGMFPNSDLKRYFKGEPLAPLSEYGVTIYHDGAMFPVKEMVCPEMKYAAQPVAAHCSGFLVGPDLLVTAGHCVPRESSCENNSWVFDFKVKKNGKVDIKKRNVFKCKEIISQELIYAEPIYDPEEYAEYEKCVASYGGYGGYMASSHCSYPTPIAWDYEKEADFALVRLDRKVWFRKPFKVRTDGEIKLGTKVAAIGHPLGLPTKVTSGGIVSDQLYPNTFSANLDAFKGNSGSAVINEETGVVEGILVTGWDPFAYDSVRDCYYINPYDQMGFNVPESDWGMSRKDLLTGVTKITSIKALMDLIK